MPEPTAHDPTLPSDVHAQRFPISIKGVVEIQGKIALLRNARGEWELPGGKLERGEVPERCAEREVLEELNVRARAGQVLDVWVYDVMGKVEVLIVTFAMQLLDDAPDLRISHEHKEVQLFHHDEVPRLHMPDGYKRSIAAYRALR